MIKTFIVEDEEKSRMVLTDLLEQLAPDFNICGSASHIKPAIAEIESNEPALLFMDVQLADGSCFEVLRKLKRRQFEIIFVTAFDNYAIEAFQFSAIDYILKPIGAQDLRQAIDKARNRLLEKNHYQRLDNLLQSVDIHHSTERKITIPTINGYEFIDLEEIVWCKSEGHYTMIYLSNKRKLTSSRHLGFYEEMLSNYNFCRINHGIIINIRFMKTYVKGKGGFVIMKDGTELEVSQRRKSEFLLKLGL